MGWQWGKMRELKMSRFIAIVSGKGGVGKTSSVVSLGSALASIGKKVLLVDANFSAPNLGIHLNIIDPEMIIINGEITEDRILLRSAQSEENSWSFWFGPYISLPPGKYRVTFNLKVNPAPSMEDKIIMLEVVKDHGANIMVSMNLYGKNILENQSSSGCCKITLEFSTETWIREVEFRGVDPSKKYDIYLAYILLEKIH